MFKFVYKNLDVSHKLGVSAYPEDEYAKHIHYHYELLFICKGSLLYTIEGVSHTLKEGSVVLVHPGQIHFAQVNDETTYERFVLKFPDSILPDFLNEKLSKLGSVFKDSSKYSLLFKNFDNYVKNFDNYDELYTLFFCDITKLCLLISNDKSSDKHFKNAVISAVLEYIDNHICENITLDTLTDIFHVSKSYINNEFKKQMHTTIMKYIRIKKTIYAHKLILNGERKNVVARKLGFEEYSTFYRCYSKIIGKNFNEDDLRLYPTFDIED